MSFISWVFLIFLPLVLLGYYLLPHRFRWVWLLLASYFFYAFYNAWLALLIFGVTLTCYGAAIGIEKRPKHRKVFLVLAILLALGCLFVFKYLDFLLGTISFFVRLGGGRGFDALSILLPVGISFYTFQSLSYVFDVYRGTAKAERHFGYFALFVSYFPQLVAGPIERFDHLMPQLKVNHPFDGENIWIGLRYVLLGYIKKVVIADSLAIAVNAVYGGLAAYDGSAILLATVLFAFQIYGDFSGYSDIAKGCSKMMGIDLMENFDSPYLATSPRDFWRRWHISLSRWFGTYVYIPLGGNKKGKPHQILNLLIVFLLSGLWHGADWKFVLWGLIHGVFVSLESLFPRKEQTQNKALIWLKRIGTFLVIDFAWIFFRANSIGDAGLVVTKIFTSWNVGTGIMTILTPAFCLQLLMSFGLLSCWKHLPSISRQKNMEDNIAAAFALSVAVTLILFCWLSHDVMGGGSSFIYFQF